MESIIWAIIYGLFILIFVRYFKLTLSDFCLPKNWIDTNALKTKSRFQIAGQMSQLKANLT